MNRGRKKQVFRRQRGAMPLAWNAVELAATKIGALAIIHRRAGIAMMMPLRRRRRGMIVRLFPVVVMVMRGAKMSQRLGERFHRAIRRRTDKNQRDSAGEIF